MSIATDGFGSIIANLEIGGGGGAVIPDGGTISGTIESSVLCEGDVTVTGPLEVKGSMIVRGDFTNSVGAEVIVRGSLFAQDIYFDKDDKTTPQSNFTVDGDMFFTYMEFRQCAGTPAELRVGGDLIGSSGYSGTVLNGNGETGNTPGLSILVYGDLTVSYVNISGNNGSTTDGGNGGQCHVYGNLTVWERYEANGGEGPEGFSGGSGGTLEVYGDVSAGYGWFTLVGGNGNQGNGGNGGNVTINGNAVIEELEVYGGDCYSDSNQHRAGSGGSLSAEGNVNLNSTSNLSGGERTGTLSEGGNTLSPADGGYVWVEGNLTVDGDLLSRGGPVQTNNYSPCTGGGGGQIYVRGDFSCKDDVRIHGGAATHANGGWGGTLNVNGSIYINDEFEAYGHLSNGGNGGDGGSLSCDGHAAIGYLDVRGGTGNEGNGGGGGSVYIDFDLQLDENAYLNGGDCSSTVPGHRAGQGGYMTCGGVNTDSTISLGGGFRSGSVTGSSPGNWPANGGNFYCFGPANGNFESLGGSVIADADVGAAGTGGNMTFYGSLYSSSSVNVNGGDCAGGNGGNGGSVSVHGFATISHIYARGGLCFNGGFGVGSSTNGAGGNVSLDRGVVGYEIQLQDASGDGAAPTGPVGLNLTGDCRLDTIQMSDRPACSINQGLNIPLTLRVYNLPLKKTLNNGNGTVTPDVSAFLDDSIFLTTSAGSGYVWHKITGTNLNT